MRIEIAQAKNKQFFWRIVSDNNKTMATSETYTRHASARKAVSDFLHHVFYGEVPIKDLTEDVKQAKRG